MRQHDTTQAQHETTRDDTSTTQVQHDTTRGYTGTIRQTRVQHEPTEIQKTLWQQK